MRSLTQRCGRRCPLLREWGVRIHDPETWRSSYTRLWIQDLIWLALSCRERESDQDGERERHSRRDWEREQDNINIYYMKYCHARGLPIRRDDYHDQSIFFLLTLSMCGCVWWAVGWAALQVGAVSSPSPKPGCPPSGRGRRAAAGCAGRRVAAGGPPARRGQGRTSWLVAGSCVFCFFLLLWVFSNGTQGRRGRRVTPPAWQEWMWGRGGIQRGGLIGGVQQQYPEGKERERERFFLYSAALICFLIVHLLSFQQRFPVFQNWEQLKVLTHGVYWSSRHLKIPSRHVLGQI